MIYNRGQVLRYKNLLIGSIIAIAVGIILWVFIGPFVALLGITSHTEGWWIFGQTVTDYTPVFWVGVAISIAGIIVLVGGIVGIILSLILEFLARKPESIVSEVPNQKFVFCTHCGNRIPANSEYCPRCGTKVQT